MSRKEEYYPLGAKNEFCGSFKQPRVMVGKKLLGDLENPLIRKTDFTLKLTKENLIEPP